MNTPRTKARLHHRICVRNALRYPVDHLRPCRHADLLQKRHVASCGCADADDHEPATIMRTTQESLKTVPQSYREGAFGLGAGKWRTIRTVVLPSCVDGIVTGCILSIGRILASRRRSYSRRARRTCSTTSLRACTRGRDADGGAVLLRQGVERYGGGVRHRGYFDAADDAH